MFLDDKETCKCIFGDSGHKSWITLSPWRQLNIHYFNSNCGVTIAFFSRGATFKGVHVNIVDQSDEGYPIIMQFQCSIHCNFQQNEYFMHINEDANHLICMFCNYILKSTRLATIWCYFHGSCLNIKLNRAYLMISNVHPESQDYHGNDSNFTSLTHIVETQLLFSCRGVISKVVHANFVKESDVDIQIMQLLSDIHCNFRQNQHFMNINEHANYLICIFQKCKWKGILLATFWCHF